MAESPKSPELQTSPEKEEEEDTGLQLDDLIKIISPNNPVLNDQEFVIEQIDQNKIIIGNVDTLQTEILYLDDEGNFEHDKQIEGIQLLLSPETS